MIKFNYTKKHQKRLADKAKSWISFLSKPHFIQVTFYWSILNQLPYFSHFSNRSIKELRSAWGSPSLTLWEELDISPFSLHLIAWKWSPSPKWLTDWAGLSSSFSEDSSLPSYPKTKRQVLRLVFLFFRRLLYTYFWYVFTTKSTPSSALKV